MTFQPTDFVDSKGERFAVEQIADRSVVLVSGIGNPSAFEETCSKVGLTIRDRIWFPDHHHFTESDVESIREKAGDALVVVTLKDLVKLPATLPALALNISATIVHETEGQRLQQLLRDAVLQ
jgi:tetraacyldisaccharide 4'-kinase